MIPNRGWNCLAVAMAVLAGAGQLLAGQAVEVRYPNSLTEQNVRDGRLAGQSFVLGPQTVFDVTGAVAGPFGGFGSGGFETFDFAGSTINMQSDSYLLGDSWLQNVTLNLISRVYVAGHLQLEQGASAHAYGGRFAQGPEVRSGGLLYVAGADVGDQLSAWNGATVEMTSGSIGRQFSAYSGSTVRITGGVVGPAFQMNAANVTIGGDARLAGTVFVNSGNLQIEGGTFEDRLYLGRASTLQINAGKVALDGGIEARRFARIDVSGGQVGAVSIDSGGRLDLKGGSVEAVLMSPDSEVQVDAGETKLLGRDGRAEVHGGHLSRIRVSGSKVTITGGQMIDRTNRFLDGFDFYSSELSISGGYIPAELTVAAGSNLELLVQDAAIDGVPLDLTGLGPLNIDQRDGSRLTATLTDGTPFQIDLLVSGVEYRQDNFIDASSRLTVVQVPEPATLSLLAMGALLLRPHRRD